MKTFVAGFLVGIYAFAFANARAGEFKDELEKQL
jgi:hypothetical protein